MSLISFLSSRLSPREPQTQPPQNHTTTGIRYPHILRRATTHWWKGPAAIATTLGGAILAVAAVRFSLPALGTAEPNGTPTPAAAAALNLALASLIPISIGAVAAVYRISGGYLHSISGRMRWKWLATGLATTVPIWIVGNLAETIVTGESTFSPAKAWALQVALTLILTPLQAAGEEYIVRGLLVTTISSYFSNAKVGFCIAGAISTFVFTALHGSSHPWVVANLVGMSIMALYLVWHTGGIEAAIAIHVANNLSLILISIFTNTVGKGQITAETQVSFWSTFYALALLALGTFLLRRFFDREGLSATTQSEPEPGSAIAATAETAPENTTKTTPASDSDSTHT
ncbi:CPBP family intramembrane glutamic endopeptidase [Dermatophilus congolensis]|uniref:CPBP family intramembrane glutamic endopeptidase n=1 Tax=Dermatophilus congolensis TaxID=1863 RepID=UPI001AAE94A4|nr:CPBP family intramembrane glutamic endopeptidase [Dermatophilus congolensis]MBO3143954.1 CPBP family intramembrane metalloprotease [Dermatophilus congolensis]MBO3152944.1 CPBP family intramembrane metalloprotease [Dermatophilus congolensis]MBO3160044.1 CPBP family intramembrane metalloprotease [Dermatophilus congolensis]MBO3164232.1 CPBP family intramembrane metalloprotease [Dermatophilus congolensis]MBO3177776.1 CPBP family intramembrane metalloprotease [Dermatophilus congolensis]